MGKLMILWAALGWAAQAATIANVSVQNLSTADTAQQSFTAQAEWRTASLSTTAPVSNGNFTTWQSHFGAFAAIRPIVDALGISATWRMQYTLSFDVLDPLNQGYLLFASTDSRGWVTAEYSTESVPGASLLFEQQGLITEVLDAQGNWQLAPNLSFDPSSHLADENLTSFNDLLASSGSGLSGALFGSRNVSFRFTMDLFLQSPDATVGEIAFRYGLNPSLAGFAVASTPGSDGEELSQLGHFVTIGMFSAQGEGNEVPEVSTALLLAVPLGFLVLRRMQYRG